MKQYLLSIYQPDGELPASEVLEQIAGETQAVQERVGRGRVGVLGRPARCQQPRRCSTRAAKCR